MKRIIQCPHCETKLAVFDIGKPISQKCPKCGKSINVASEEASSGSQIDDKKPNNPQPVADTARPDVNAALDALPAHETAGGGGLFKAFAVGALLIIIVMQLITKRNSNKQYNMLNENLKTIAKKLGN